MSEEEKNRWVWSQLDQYAETHQIRGKGYLSVGLVVTRTAREKEFPLDENDFLSGKRGQVKGLGQAAVQKILADHDITRVLAKEGGRTSRGSLQNMRDYVTFLNSLAEREGFDLGEVERWWIHQVRCFFSAKPFLLKVTASSSLRRAIRDVLEQAEKRQNEGGGTMFVGAVMQHLVGAKLEHVLGEEIEHHGFSVADEPLNRPGDFHIGTVAVHVTNSPTDALLQKCKDNIDSGLQPLIITSNDGVIAAEIFAQSHGIRDKVDLFEIEQFFATNLYEMSRFNASDRKPTVEVLIDRYNQIVREHETDPGFEIVVA